MKQLLEKNAEINAQSILGNTPLHEAAMYGNAEATEILLKRGAQKNIKNKRTSPFEQKGGYTPLEAAKAIFEKRNFKKETYQKTINLLNNKQPTKVTMKACSLA